MPDQTLQYTVELLKRGDGAKLATAELQQVDVAQRQVNASAAAVNFGYTNLQSTAKQTGKALNILGREAAILGVSALPQASGSLFALSGGMRAVSGISAATGASIGAVAAALLGLVAVIYQAAQAWKLYSANAATAASANALKEQGSSFADSLQKEIEQRKTLGSISAEEARLLEEHLASIRARGNQMTALIALARELRKETATGVLEDPNARARRERELYSDAKPGLTEFARRGLTPTQRDVADAKQKIDEMQAASAKYFQFLQEQYAVDSDQFRKLQERKMAVEKFFDQQRREAGNLVLQDMRRISEQGQELFANGLAGAIVGAFKEGGKAFQQFASQFFATIAQMILQSLILRSIQGILGGVAGGSGVGGARISLNANGGVHFAAAGLAGVSSVSSPTYFPKFNTVAGEAGREMLTVLARPRMMNLGGIEAAVGSAQGNMLAITSAGALAARGGAGGEIVIKIQHTPEAEARIVQSSIHGARVQVAEDMNNDTPISRGARRLGRQS